MLLSKPVVGERLLLNLSKNDEAIYAVKGKVTSQ